MTDSGITITAMMIDHVDDVLRLWEDTDGVILMDTDNAEDLPRYFERNPGISQVALDNGTVVGAVLCGHDGRRGYLHHLAVATSYRQRGIGRALVEACTHQLADAGITACNLFVENENCNARSFWRHHDWKLWQAIRVMSFRFPGRSDN